MKRPSIQPVDIEQLLRIPPRLRDGDFSETVVARIARYKFKRRAILSCVWLIALVAAMLMAPWQFIANALDAFSAQVSGYSAQLSLADIEMPTVDATTLLQNHGLLVVVLAILVPVLLAGVMAQD